MEYTLKVFPFGELCEHVDDIDMNDSYCRYCGQPNAYKKVRDFHAWAVNDTIENNADGVLSAYFAEGNDSCEGWAFELSQMSQYWPTLRFSLHIESDNQLNSRVVHYVNGLRQVCTLIEEFDTSLLERYISVPF
jgi:hypothetical protein